MQSPAAAMAAAVVLSVLTFALRPLLQNRLGGDPVLVLAAPAVVLSAWLGGFWPGTLAIVLAMVGRAAWAQISHEEMFNGAYALRSIIAVPSALAVCAAFEQIHRARRRAEMRAIVAENAALAAQHLSAALQALPVSVFDMDLELRYVRSINPPLGMRPGQLVGKRAEDVVDAATAERLNRVRRDVIATGVARQLEVEATTAKGWHCLDLFVTPLRNDAGTIVGLTNITVDITDKKRRELAERRAQERMQRLVDSSAVAIAFSRGGVITEANDAFLMLMGFTPEDLRAGRINQGSLIPADERDVYLRAKQELDETGRNGPFHAVLRRPDDILVDVITSAGRLGDDDYCIFLTDISALTRAERALRVSEERLRTIVGEREKALDALHLADQQKDRFIATLAHELRNPLAPIANGARLLALKPDDAKVVTWSAQAIERQVKQLTHLLDDLLDVSRISRNTLHLQRRRMALQEAVELAAEQVRPFLEAQGHRLALDLPEVPGEGLELLGDLARLAQVFANLLHNAAKYTPQPGLITLAARRDGDRLVVTVTDPGLGIALQDQQRVFEMFSQAHPELRNSHPGLGIGLALVRGIAQIHGGSVGVESEGVGHGSRFIVRLPALPAGSLRASTVDTDVADPLQALGGYRVLVVDDNVDSAESIAALLVECGSTVRTTFNGQAAIDAGPEFAPAVVLMDIGMPGLDGLQAATLMRETPWGRSAVLIAMTGFGQPEDKRRALQAGFDHHLTKPVNLELLAQCLAGDGQMP